jgi:N-acylglucosamine 2-epimerase
MTMHTSGSERPQPATHDPEGQSRFDLEHLNVQILPWWYTNAVDDERGGVLTCFDNQGALLSTDKYTWSQGRWAWLMGRVFRAGRSGLTVAGSDAALERAAGTADFLAGHAVLEGGMTAYQTTREGEPVPQPAQDGALHTSVYSDLFAVLGFAGAIGAARAATDTAPFASRIATWTSAATEVLRSASARVSDGTALTEPYPVPAGMTSLGVRMMQLNAASELYAATGSPEVEQEALRSATALAESLRSGDGSLPSDFGFADGVGDTDSLISRHRTPGHVLEALWFLVDAGAVMPQAAELVGPWMPELARRALELGWDTECGGLLRYADRAGGAPQGTRSGSRYEDLVAATWSTKLWWPHAEALYALPAIADATGSDLLWEWNDRIRDYTYATFPAAPGQEWTQIRDRQGRPLNEVVALPVKDPFHIGRALLLSALRGTTEGNK